MKKRQKRDKTVGLRVTDEDFKWLLNESNKSMRRPSEMAYIMFKREMDRRKGNEDKEASK